MARRDWKPGRERARRSELHYARQLRKIAYHIGEIVGAFTPADPAALPPLQQAMDAYGRAIEPWAHAVTRRMHEDVDSKDLAAWMQLTADMRRGLRDELRDAPTGMATQQLMREQVDLITSLPRWAGERVHELTLEAITDSTRYDEIALRIRATSDVTVSRANLIARTEVSRTASVLCQARAQHVGCTEYVWRTSGDADVRPTHRKLANSVQRWDRPPKCDEPDYHAHAGAIWNCRCYPEPIIPDE